MMSQTEIDCVVGRRLAAARGKRGMTQGEVAAAAGIHRPTYTLLEAGRQRMTVDLLIRLCAALGIDPAEVITEASRAA